MELEYGKTCVFKTAKKVRLHDSRFHFDFSLLDQLKAYSLYMELQFINKKLH